MQIFQPFCFAGMVISGKEGDFFGCILEFKDYLLKFAKTIITNLYYLRPLCPSETHVAQYIQYKKHSIVMNRFLQLLADRNSTDILRFALIWSLIIALVSWPMSMGLGISMGVITVMFVLSIILRLKSIGWSILALTKRGVSHTESISMIAFMMSFWIGGCGSEELRSVSAIVATIVLIVGLTLMAIGRSAKHSL